MIDSAWDRTRVDRKRALAVFALAAMFSVGCGKHRGLDTPDAGDDESAEAGSGGTKTSESRTPAANGGRRAPATGAAGRQSTGGAAGRTGTQRGSAGKGGAAGASAAPKAGDGDHESSGSHDAAGAMAPSGGDESAGASASAAEGGSGGMSSGHAAGAGDAGSTAAGGGGANNGAAGSGAASGGAIGGAAAVGAAGEGGIGGAAANGGAGASDTGDGGAAAIGGAGAGATGEAGVGGVGAGASGEGGAGGAGTGGSSDAGAGAAGDTGGAGASGSAGSEAAGAGGMSGGAAGGGGACQRDRDCSAGLICDTTQATCQHCSSDDDCRNHRRYGAGSSCTPDTRLCSTLCASCGGCEEVQETSTDNHHTDDLIDYPDPPPTSGPHNECWATWGVHDAPVTDERWVHNLEHGGIVFLYNCPDGCAADVATLSQLVMTHPRTVLTSYSLLPNRFAAVAWGRRLITSCVDATAFSAFYSENFDQAPESDEAQPASSCPP